jgi:tetratricopeptide (TPR) repeat protein
VKYFPLFPNDLSSKAQDLYFDAIEEFKLDKESVAIELLKKAIALKPDFEDAYESLGVIYGREGDNHKAIELMKKLSELNPKSVMAHTNLSLYYMKIGDKETAEHHKAEATLKQFEVLGDQAKRKREIEQKQQQELADLDRKEKMFKEVLEIDPEDALANHGLGEIEYKRKNYFKSESYLKKAIETDPKYSVAYLLLAKVLKDSMKIEEFAKVAQEGIKIATKNGDMMPANELQLLLNEK